VPVAYFRCLKCKRTFDTFEGAQGCEDAHLRPKSVKAVEYTVRPFPYSVEVKFNNGEKRIYNAQDLGG